MNDTKDRKFCRLPDAPAGTATAHADARHEGRCLMPRTA